MQIIDQTIEYLRIRRKIAEKHFSLPTGQISQEGLEKMLEISDLIERLLEFKNSHYEDPWEEVKEERPDLWSETPISITTGTVTTVEESDEQDAVEALVGRYFSKENQLMMVHVDYEDFMPREF